MGGIKKLTEFIASEHELSVDSKRKAIVVKKVAIIIAIAIFAIGTVVALYNFPLDVADLDVFYLVWVLVAGVPLTVLLNSAEYRYTAKLKNKTIPVFESIKVTIISTAANMLPLPGGVIARTSALRAAGISIKDGVHLNVIAGVMWLGMAFLYSGFFLLYIRPVWFSMLCVLAGGGVFLWAFIKLIRVEGAAKINVVYISLVKFFLLVLDSARLVFCFLALDVDVSFVYAATLSLSSVVGSAVSIVPAGLGIRELTASFIGQVIGVAMASAFLATALNRLLGMIAIIPIALAVGRGSND